MIIPTLLFLLLHPGAPPTEWSPVDGAPLVRYRWSRPSENTCLVELENDDPYQSVKLNGIATVVSNNPPPQKSQSPFQRPNLANRTIVRPQTSGHTFQVKLNRLDRAPTSVLDCFGIVHLKGSVMSSSEDMKPKNPYLQQKVPDPLSHKQ